MQSEQQQIAIAEACGWKRADLQPDDAGFNMWTKDNVRLMVEGLPDYLNDLNAIHSAIKQQKFDAGFFLNQLDISCGGELQLSDMLDGPDLVIGLVLASPKQLAEALLRTLNRWTDS